MPSGIGPTAGAMGAKEGNGGERRGSTSSEGSATSSSTHTRSSCAETSEYLQAARSRAAIAAAPKPAANPLQFVKIGPCNLYRSAQEQLKKAEEIKKQTAKDVRRDHQDDWQSNLDNWKSSRRKQVEHIIERCVEVKRLELEEHDRSRRRSKTFSEMMEDRAGRRNGRSRLPIYCEEDNNDLSDLGIGTSSASGKSSLSEDCDNHSLASDGMDLDKNHSDLDNMSSSDTGNRKLGSSANEYDTCTTATISSPEPEEYTYEGAIQNYKSRIISRTLSSDAHATKVNGTSDNTKEKTNGTTPIQRASIGSKIESKLSSFEATRESSVENTNDKKALPKVDVLKKRELFEKENSPELNGSAKTVVKTGNNFSNSKSIKERLSHLEKLSEDTNSTKTVNKISTTTSTLKDRLNNLEKSVSDTDKNFKLSNGDLTSVTIKDRLSNLNTRNTPEKIVNNSTIVVTTTLKDRLANLDSAKNRDVSLSPEKETEEKFKLNGLPDNKVENTKISNNDQHNTDRANNSVNGLSENKKFHRSLDSLDTDDNSQTEKFERIQSMEILCTETCTGTDTDREDSGIHTGDVSSAVSQDEEPTDNFSIDTSADLPNKNDSPTISKESSEHLLDESKNDDVSISHASVVEDDSIAQEDSISAYFEKDEEDTVKSLDPDNSVFDELEVAFQLIDKEETIPAPKVMAENFAAVPDKKEHISITSSIESMKLDTDNTPKIQSEPQTIKPIPLYENIELLYPSGHSTNNDFIGFPLGPPINAIQPPKEKPPPPPIDDLIDDEIASDAPLKRLNSTKRIKKEIRNKRSSFLGIEGMDDDSYLEPELKLAPRPDITTFLQEETRVDKMFYRKSLYYDSDSNLGESRDSGVELDRVNIDDPWSNKQVSPDVLSEQHSRQGSEPFTNTSLTSDEDVNKKENDIVDENQKNYQNARIVPCQNVIGHQLTYKLKELEQEKFNLENQSSFDKTDDQSRIKSLENQIKEQQEEIKERCNDSYDDGHSEEVLRVERELLQLEQEELKRQRDSLMLKESQARRANGRSLQDINMAQTFSTPPPNSSQIYSYTALTPPNVNYRQSMPNLAMKQAELSHFTAVNPINFSNVPKNAPAIKKLPPPIPPAKPVRSLEMQEREITLRNSRIPSAEYSNIDDLMMRPKPNTETTSNNASSHNQMSRHTLQALSAAPRSRLIPGAEWLQPKRRSEPPPNYNYNQHWLIQEAEQRRIDQLRSNIKKQSQSTNLSNGSRSKHLPDAVIQTLTQRVQNMNTNRPPPPPAIVPAQPPADTSEKMLSVSGKKKCSHCGEELGRGAAMIIESLRLFYHLSCFKCCVCGVRLGDGRLGADVRVRHNQLHCHNCYSSDDGVKFSCV